MILERYADGSEGAKVRMLVRGDSLTVRANDNMAWKYGEEKECTCEEEENERHVLFECQQYEEWRQEGKRRWREEMGEMDIMGGVLGYIELSRELETLVLRMVGRIWRERERREARR